MCGCVCVDVCVYVDVCVWMCMCVASKGSLAHAFHDEVARALGQQIAGCLHGGKGWWTKWIRHLPVDVTIHETTE